MSVDLGSLTDFKRELGQSDLGEAFSSDLYLIITNRQKADRINPGAVCGRRGSYCGCNIDCHHGCAWDNSSGWVGHGTGDCACHSLRTARGNPQKYDG